MRLYSPVYNVMMCSIILYYVWCISSKLLLKYFFMFIIVWLIRKNYLPLRNNLLIMSDELLYRNTEINKYSV